MKKKLFIVFGILIVLMTGAYFLLHYFLQPEKIRLMVIENIENIWDGEVEVGKASVNLIPASISLSNFKLSSNKTELISLSSLVIIPDLSEIFSGKINISSINLVDPKVSLNKNSNDELLISKCLESKNEESELKKKSEPNTKDTTESDSFISEININRISITNLLIGLPSDNKTETTDIGPFDSQLKLTLAPKLKVSGNISCNAKNYSSGDNKVNAGKISVKLDVNNDIYVINVHIDESTLTQPATGQIKAGPIDGTITVNPNGTIYADKFIIALAPAGKIEINANVISSPQAKTMATVNCTNISLSHILKQPLSSLNLSENGKKLLTISTLTGSITKTKDEPVLIKDFSGKMGGKTTISMNGQITSAENYNMSANVNSVSIYSLLEGIIEEYKFGSPIEKLSLNKVKITASAKGIKVPQIKLTMGNNTYISGTMGLIPDKDEIFTFDKTSKLNVKVDGDALFSLLNLKPDSKLTGTLAGTIKLSDSIINPSASGILKSPLLKYIYTGAPSVPLTNVVAKVSLRDLKGKVDKLTGNIFGGSIDGSAECNLKITPFSYTWKLDTMKLEMSHMVKEIPMLKDHITGRLSIALKGSGTGVKSETESLLSKMSLDGDIKSIETKILNTKGLITPALGNGAAANLVKGKVDEMLTTPELKNFDLATLTSTVHIKDGDLIFNNVNSTGLVGMKSDGVSINGNDTKLKGTVTFTIPHSGKKLDIPIKLDGDLLSPKLSISAAALKNKLAKEELNKVKSKVEDKVNELLGGKTEGLLKNLFN